MPTKICHKPTLANLSCLLIVGFLLLQNLIAGGQQVDTLYLRDGSVLRGDVVNDSASNYIVYNKYGEFTVKAEEVIYLISKEKDDEVTRETYIVTGKDSEVISILQKAIPARDDNWPGFSLLVPGAVVAIFDADNEEIPYETTSLGSVSIVKINYDDIISAGKSLFITTRQPDFLKSSEQGQVIYNHNFTSDSEVIIKLLVKYPSDWRAEKIAPEPTKKYPGLIIWELKLRRQQNFNPTITFGR